MAEEFKKSVEFGLKLSKRIYYGKEEETSTKPPKRIMSMEKSAAAAENYLPTSPMVYAVISNPEIIDNPDIRSYQPYVHGRCQPPALIPLHMYDVKVEVECYVDVAFVTVIGTWRVHCVSATKTCDCRLAIPMGEQGSVLGFEVEASGGSYLSQLVKVDDTEELNGLIKDDNGGLLNPNIFTLKIPKVNGGSKLLVKARWSQKLIYRDGQMWFSLPFSFPSYVTPVGQFFSKQKISLNVNCGMKKEVLCNSATHPLKALKRQVGKFGFLYEEETYTWSKTDFEFSYTVSSSEIHGAMLVQTPPSSDFDRREIFTFYLFPGSTQNNRVFRKRVVFLVDISGSMKGAPLENAKEAVLGSLSKFNQDDSFNIIAFNKETYSFSPSMTLATQEALEQASEWFNNKLVAEGDTDIMLPMKQALDMVSHEKNSVSYIFLITDGAVENEADICNVVKDSYINKEGSPATRISTFGIGSYCNHYFLRMLAQIGRGHYDAGYDSDSVALRLQRFLTMSSSVILSNIEVDCLSLGESPKLHPAAIQDLSYESPVMISRRSKGKLPESVEVSGTLADMRNFTINLKVQEVKDIPLDKVYARTQIDALTAIAWFTGSSDVAQQVAEISLQTGFQSEYTRMILVRTKSGDQESALITIQGEDDYDRRSLLKMIRCKDLVPLHGLGVGFGDLKKTAENLPPGVTVKVPDATDKIVRAATGCCHQFLDRFCCMCFLQTISALSDRCVITLSQICTALSCCACLDCCYDLCGNC